MGSQYTEKLIAPLLSELDKRRVSRRLAIRDIRFRAAVYFGWDRLFEDSDEWKPFPEGETWGGTDAHFCFRASVEIPPDMKKGPVSCLLTTGATNIWNYDNPQFIVFVNGEIHCGLDVNHVRFDLPSTAVESGTADLGFFGYSNNGKKDAFFSLELLVPDREVDRLYWDLKVPFDALKTLHEDSAEWLSLAPILASAANALDLRERDGPSFRASIARAEKILEDGLYSSDRPFAPAVTEYCVGHTHIDVAWLWTLDQTREKVMRSFANALYLLDRYPEFTFMSSQPVLYEFLREKAPELYSKVKARVAEGRWEAEGGMWLEADCNLTSGESLVRQIVRGKRFMHREFGVDSRVLWLPDVFGYSAALPQIMKRSGLDYFMTTKIAWNDTNRIPHDTMWWKGIDGTKRLTHFITTCDFDKFEMLSPRRSFATTYNGTLEPKQVKGCWQRYADKEINSLVLQCFGNGDGGGGPTADMLENARRMDRGLPGCPAVKHSGALAFFRDLERAIGESPKTPVWSGEFYLEFHRGTYTSMASIKLANRRAEFALCEAEFAATLAGFLLPPGSVPYPAAELDECWRLALLNQFHDILPGSAIAKVYEESARQYEELFSRTGSLIRGAYGAVAAGLPGSGIAVFNPLSWSRSDIVLLPPSEPPVSVFDGGEELPSRRLADGSLEVLVPVVPSMGFRAFETRPVPDRERRPSVAKASPKTLSTAFYDVEFDDCGFMVSLIDRAEGREVLISGERGNLLMAFDDRPAEYDAWNIDPQYAERHWIVDSLESFVIVCESPLGIVLRQRRRFLSSSIEQEIFFYAHTRRIDFKTTVDWKESHLLLKVSFPVDVAAARASYEIQYGFVERDTHRNTSWDQARFESVGHTWADVSEGGYGVTLMNDSKYGYDIHESVMRLSLLRSPTYPNPEADRCVHSFTYALYPHSGSLRQSSAVAEAHFLNRPLRGIPVPAAECSPVPDTGVAAAWAQSPFEFVSVDSGNIVVSALKGADDGRGWILRAYESLGMRTKASFKLPYAAAGWAVTECDLLENSLESVACNGRSFKTEMRPFDIRTFRILQIETMAQDTQ